MSDLFAAIDLGSNSFHLLLARRQGDRYQTVERLKEKVQLLAGFHQGRLDAAAMARGEACLARFAQRLTALPRRNIVMVGTHALREAANRADFARRAEHILGVPLEVVSGEEEARLINLGVAQQVPRRPGRGRLVVDIGGGSTELAWSNGDGGRPERLVSYPVGCVSLTDAFFGPDADQAAAFRSARERTQSILDGLAPLAPGSEVIGTSGTVESVQSVLAANGWGEQRIGAEGLAALTDAVASGRWLVGAGLPGLAPERVDIFAAGLAIVEGLFRRLQPADMRFADVSLQDGLIYRNAPLPGPHRDPRDLTVADWQARFAVDTGQARRVRETALMLFDGTAGWWAADGSEPRAGDFRALLGWAADLHEVGQAVAPWQYHRHGGYLLQHAPSPAFSRTEQTQLALLVRGHRRAFPGLAFRAYDDSTRRALVRLLALLRLAVILHRGHAAIEAPRAAVEDARLILTLPAGWLAAHPLSATELETESEQLRRAGIDLVLAETP